MNIKKIIIMVMMILIFIPISLADRFQTGQGDVIADAHIAENAPNDNYGTGNNLYLDERSGTKTFPYIMIDTSNISNNENATYIIDSCNLTLKVNTYAVGMNIGSHEVNETWEELGITWNNAPCESGGGMGNSNVCNTTASDTKTLGAAIDYIWDVSGIVRSSVTSEAKNTSFAMYPTDGADVGNNIFDSRDVAGTFPRLVCDFTTTADITPPVLSISSPLNNTRNNSLPMPIYITATDAAPTVTCVLRNETEIFDSGDFSTGTPFSLTYYNTTAEIEQIFNFNITCGDNSAANNTVTELLNITIDNINPLISVTLPGNNTEYDKTFNNLSYDALCTDRLLLYFNISLSDENGVAASFQNNSGGTENQLKGDLDLTDVTPGDYKLNYTCADPHTHIDSKIKSFSKNLIEHEIDYITNDDNNIIINSEESILSICDYGSYGLTDREVFWYDFYTCNQAFGVLEKPEYVFTIRDKKLNLKYLPDSPYKGHFVTKDNFITFHLDNPDAEYIVKKIHDSHYEIRIKTWDRYLTFNNSVGGLNIVKEFYDVNITETLYTAMRHVEFDIDEIIFDSASFVPILNQTFNMSSNSKIYIATSLNAEKFTHPAESSVSVQYKIDETVVSEQEIITLTSAGDIKSVNIPFVEEDLNTGEHTLTISVSEDGTGSVRLYNIHSHFYTNKSQNGDLITSLDNFEATFSNTAYASVYQWNVSKIINNIGLKNIPLYIEPSITFFSVTGGEPHCRINDGLNLSPSFIRDVGSLETGSSGTNWVSDRELVNVTLDLECYSQGGDPITINGTMFNMVLGHDTANEYSQYYINYLQSSNEVYDTYTLEQLIIDTKNYLFKASGSLTYIVSSIIASNSGVHIPYLFINNSLGLITGHDRTVTNVGGIGTVKFYADADNASIGEYLNTSFYTDISAGEGLDIYNSSMSMIEVDLLNTTVGNLPPLLTVFYPSNNSNVRLTDYINFTASDPNGDAIVIDISLFNGTTTPLASNLPGGTQNISFNYSTLTLGEYVLNVTVRETTTPDLFRASEFITLTIVGIVVNLTSPQNNTDVNTNTVTFVFNTDFISNCSLYLDDPTLTDINQSIAAVDGGNAFAPVYLANGTHTWQVECIDGTISGLSEEYSVNVVIIPFESFTVGECPTDLDQVIILGFLFLLTFGLLIMGFWKSNITGLFAAILLIILSWYVGACIAIFSFGLGSLGIMLIIIFGARIGLSGEFS